MDYKPQALKHVHGSETKYPTSPPSPSEVPTPLLRPCTHLPQMTLGRPQPPPHEATLLLQGL